jgi:hypothetical protein
MFECGGYGDALSIEVSGSVVKLYCGKPHHFTFTTINAVFLGECHASCNYKTFFEYFERKKSSSTVPLPTFTVAFKDDVALGFTF